jgi:hypothetical protein
MKEHRLIIKLNVLWNVNVVKKKVFQKILSTKKKFLAFTLLANK